MFDIVFDIVCWLVYCRPDRDPQYVMSLLKMRDSIKQVDPVGHKLCHKHCAMLCCVFVAVISAFQVSSFEKCAGKFMGWVCWLKSPFTANPVCLAAHFVSTK